MMKYIISIIAILGLFINSVFAGGHKKIKVGMITTLSGGGSGLGTVSYTHLTPPTTNSV